MNALKLVLAALAISLLGLAAPAPAHAAYDGTVRLDPPTRSVAHVRILETQQLRHGYLLVDFNTGSTWRVAPCRYEDSNNCHWDARKRGNGHGRSFVTLKGKTYYYTR